MFVPGGIWVIVRGRLLFVVTPFTCVLVIIFDLLDFLHFLVCHLSQAGVKLVLGRAGICQFCLVCYVPFGLKRWKAHWEQDIEVEVGPFP